jgi:hypothetical protein
MESRGRAVCQIFHGNKNRRGGDTGKIEKRRKNTKKPKKEQILARRTAPAKIGFWCSYRGYDP